jgi:hypothetical protein
MSAKISYVFRTSKADFEPVDPDTGEDVEGLGEGWVVSMFIPDSRRDDVDRNDTNRRQLTGIIEAAIVAAESNG